jgi:hypothetical protein
MRMRLLKTPAAGNARQVHTLAALPVTADLRRRLQQISQHNVKEWLGSFDRCGYRAAFTIRLLLKIHFACLSCSETLLRQRAA